MFRLEHVRYIADPNYHNPEEFRIYIKLTAFLLIFIFLQNLTTTASV